MDLTHHHTGNNRHLVVVAVHPPTRNIHPDSPSQAVIPPPHPNDNQAHDKRAPAPGATPPMPTRTATPPTPHRIPVLPHTPNGMRRLRHRPIRVGVGGGMGSSIRNSRNMFAPSRLPRRDNSNSSIRLHHRINNRINRRGSKTRNGRGIITHQRTCGTPLPPRRKWNGVGMGVWGVRLRRRTVGRRIRGGI